MTAGPDHVTEEIVTVGGEGSVHRVATGGLDPNRVA
jgi:hypothetical protein